MRIQVEREGIEKNMSDEEIGREITVEGLPKMARENRERRPYVVRDLSWEFARYLDSTESFSASTPATSNSVGG
jgi:hypothetical protein